MREACKFNIQIHNGNILMSSVTEDPGVSSILLFSGSGINFPRPLYLPAKKAACVSIHAILILQSIVSSDPREKNSQSLIVKFRYNPHRFQGRELCGQLVAKAFKMVWDPGQRSSGRDSTLIKKKIKFSSYIRKQWSSCKVRYDLRSPHIWGNICPYPHTVY
jgi:hypothetical protein